MMPIPVMCMVCFLAGYITCFLIGLWDKANPR